MACSSHRLTLCQGVRERWPGSAWSPHGMQQPQTYLLSRCQRKMAWASMKSTWHAAARLPSCQGVRERWPGSAWSPHGMQQPQTYPLSRCRRKMAWVSMESTWHAAATDLHSVKVSEKDGLGQHGVHMACSSHRLTLCQGVKEGSLGQHRVHMACSSHKLTLCQGVRERWPGSA